MPLVIHSESDLTVWAARVMGAGSAPGDARHAAAYVRDLPDRPEWGTDWAPFLSSFASPDLLFATLPMSGF
jgi:hypothetical protein